MWGLPIKAGLARALKSSIFFSGSVMVSHLRRSRRKNFKTVLPCEWQKAIMSEIHDAEVHDGLLACVTDIFVYFVNFSNYLLRSDSQQRILKKPIKDGARQNLWMTWSIWQNGRIRWLKKFDCLKLTPQELQMLFPLTSHKPPRISKII